MRINSLMKVLIHGTSIVKQAGLQAVPLRVKRSGAFRNAAKYVAGGSLATAAPLGGYIAYQNASNTAKNDAARTKYTKDLRNRSLLSFGAGVATGSNGPQVLNSARSAISNYLSPKTLRGPQA